ncbi:MAG TPA: OmpA family protein [Steroidobacteraceae bacterium]|nr:OmpA family protein [Steroidobacteraceae bacterium]
MKPVNHSGVIVRTTLIATSVAAVLLAACAAAPLKPDGAAEVRSKLTELQADPNLASRAPLAIKEADTAVRAAEQPQADKELGVHRVYLADRKVQTARALAETRFAEDQRGALSAQRESSRLDARTREVDVAKNQADVAKNQAAAAHEAAASSEQEAAELQRQIDVLQAKVTDRGVIVTLGDVLFESGRAELREGSAGNLNKLVAFLDKYPDRVVAIEGYTDSVGSEDYNQALSQRRADSVRSYLVRQGISSGRLTASGMGKADPVASNESASGRQQNRRVAVIINNPPTASR